MDKQEFLKKIKEKDRKYYSSLKKILGQFEKENIHYKRISYLSTIINLEILKLRKEDLFRSGDNIIEIFTLIIFIFLLNKNNLNKLTIKDIVNTVNIIINEKYNLYMEVLIINKEKYNSEVPKYMINVFNDREVFSFFMEE